jgi:hypothetical protein
MNRSKEMPGEKNRTDLVGSEVGKEFQYGQLIQLKLTTNNIWDF